MVCEIVNLSIQITCTHFIATLEIILLLSYGQIPYGCLLLIFYIILVLCLIVDLELLQPPLMEGLGLLLEVSIHFCFDIYHSYYKSFFLYWCFILLHPQNHSGSLTNHPSETNGSYTSHFDVKKSYKPFLILLFALIWCRHYVIWVRVTKEGRFSHIQLIFPYSYHW